MVRSHWVAIFYKHLLWNKWRSPRTRLSMRERTTELWLGHDSLFHLSLAEKLNCSKFNLLSSSWPGIARKARWPGQGVRQLLARVNLGRVGLFGYRPQSWKCRWFKSSGTEWQPFVSVLAPRSSCLLFSGIEVLCFDMGVVVDLLFTAAIDIVRLCPSTAAECHFGAFFVRLLRTWQPSFL